MEGEKKVKYSSWGVPKIRLDPATHAAVEADIGAPASVRGRYQDVVRALVRDGLDMPHPHAEISAAAAAEVAGVPLRLLLLLGEGAPPFWTDGGGRRWYWLTPLLRWRAAGLRARREAARAAQADLSDGVR